MTRMGAQVVGEKGARQGRAVLEIEDLAVSFGGVRAVDGMSLTVHPRQTLALVGESGCGKSVTTMTVL